MEETRTVFLNLKNWYLFEVLNISLSKSVRTSLTFHYLSIYVAKLRSSLLNGENNELFGGFQNYKKSKIGGFVGLLKNVLCKAPPSYT